MYTYILTHTFTYIYICNIFTLISTDIRFWSCYHLCTFLVALLQGVQVSFPHIIFFPSFLVLLILRLIIQPDQQLYANYLTVWTLRLHTSSTVTIARLGKAVVSEVQNILERKREYLLGIGMFPKIIQWFTRKKNVLQDFYFQCQITLRGVCLSVCTLVYTHVYVYGHMCVHVCKYMHACVCLTHVEFLLMSPEVSTSRLKILPLFFFLIL